MRLRLAGRTLQLLILAGCCVGCSEVDKGTINNSPSSQTMPTTNSNQSIAGPINYLALGDSTGTGVGAKDGGYVARLFRRIVAIKPDSELTNLCVSGATTSDLLRDQLERGVRVNPNLITLGIGINDIGHGVSLDRFAENYDAILKALSARTTAQIVVTNIPEISSAPRIPIAMRGQYQQLIMRFNQRLGEVASRYGVTVFDVYKITHQQLPDHPEYFSADGFHPSDKGYELWAETMWPTVARIVE